MFETSNDSASLNLKDFSGLVTIVRLSNNNNNYTDAETEADTRDSAVESDRRVGPTPRVVGQRHEQPPLRVQKFGQFVESSVLESVGKSGFSAITNRYFLKVHFTSGFCSLFLVRHLTVALIMSHGRPLLSASYEAILR